MNKETIYNHFLPSFLLAKERVVERSDDRVSKYGSDINTMHGIEAWRIVDSPRLRFACHPSLRCREGKKKKTAAPPFAQQEGGRSAG